MRTVRRRSSANGSTALLALQGTRRCWHPRPAPAAHWQSLRASIPAIPTPFPKRARGPELGQRRSSVPALQGLVHPATPLLSACWGHAGEF